MPDSDSQNPSVPKTDVSKLPPDQVILLRLHLPFDTTTLKAEGKEYSPGYGLALFHVEEWFTKRYGFCMEEQQKMTYTYGEGAAPYEVPGLMVSAQVRRISKISKELQCTQLMKALKHLSEDVKDLLMEYDPIYYAAEDQYEVNDV